MPLWGMLLAALAEIRIGRVRAALSTICVAIGVAVVTLVIVFAGLVQHAAQQVFEQQVGRPVTLMIDFFSPEGPSRLTTEQVERIRTDLRRYRVTGSPFATAEGITFRVNGRLLRGDEEGPPPQLMGADANLSKIRRLPVHAGRWLVTQDDLRLEPQLVIDQTFAERTGLPSGGAAVGQVIEIGAAGKWIKARVVGVLGKGLNWGMPVAYMSYGSMVRWQVGQEMTQFVVRVPAADATAVTKALKAESTRSWGLRQTAEIHRDSGDFTVIGGTLGKLALAAAAAVLMLGSLPVLALGLAAVRQRRSEFGVHRCFGATGPDLFLTVLTESLIISVAGGVIGTMLAYAGQKAALMVLHDRGPFGQGVRIDTSFPWTAALLGLGVAMCVGVFTGLIPALRAMQRSVIRAIRS